MLNTLQYIIILSTTQFRFSFTKFWSNCYIVSSVFNSDVNVVGLRNTEELFSLMPPSQVQMRLNFSFPATDCQKLTVVDGKCRHHLFYEKFIAAESLGEEWKGYVYWGWQTQYSHEARPWRMVEYASYWIRGVHLIDQEGMGRGNASLLGVCCGCQSVPTQRKR